MKIIDPREAKHYQQPIRTTYLLLSAVIEVLTNTHPIPVIPARYISYWWMLHLEIQILHPTTWCSQFAMLSICQSTEAYLQQRPDFILDLEYRKENQLPLISMYYVFSPSSSPQIILIASPSNCILFQNFDNIINKMHHKLIEILIGKRTDLTQRPINLDHWE